jgi:hypothetical protein
MPSRPGSIGAEMPPPTTDDAIALYGTDEQVEPPILLRAGGIQAELDNGNLRHIRVGGAEAIRAVSFIIRDRHWGTYSPSIIGLSVDQREDGFSVHYAAEVRDGDQSFRFRATIEGQPDRVVFSAEGDTSSGFDTCRTGFVVLHPLEGVAGEQVTVEHVDGTTAERRFPHLIDPVQPMSDLRALTHTVGPGVRVTCRMEGDTFEMEDQRNWCDASFKTYVRPLSLPWPYRIEPAEALRQAVTLTFAGEVRPWAASTETVLSIGEAIGPAPKLGLGLDPGELEATQRLLPQLAILDPAILVCHFDPRRGHDKAALEAMASIASALGAELWLEAVVAEVDGFEAEIAALGAMVEALGSPFPSVLLTPAADLKSTTPGQPWPPAPPPDAFYRVARAAFPHMRVGGGMASSFTELNRKRPPLDDLDFVGFTTMSLVHAADDTSVIQGLEALPAIARSARAIAGALPIVVGPSAIGLRLNPYGAAPLPNPGNKRLPMALNDPRHRGQLGAAWALAYYARLAAAGVDTVVIGSPTGPFGMLHTAQPWPTPGFDREGTPYPICATLQALSRLSGKILRRVTVSNSALVEAVAAEGRSGCDVILANLTASEQRVRLGDRVEVLTPFAVRTFAW